MHLSSYLLLLLVLVSELFKRFATVSNPVVKFGQVSIIGERKQLKSTKKYFNSFTGIPFALPPIGNLRFCMPQPFVFDSQVTTFNASSPAKSCYQNLDFFFGEFIGSNVWNVPQSSISEDCLQLNIWTPQNAQNLPVMVWIYGGGFYSGGTNLKLYDGGVLAVTTNVIVVSINYRLGALGFLYLNNTSFASNAGLQDQVLALNWIKKNIGLFGGNPKKITIFGESAGSVSVGLHLLSPLSSNLFQQAILQSGTPNMHWAVLNPEEAKNRSLKFIASFPDCAKINDANKLMTCLQLIDAQTIINNQWVVEGIMQFPFLPVIDGSFLPDHPKKLLDENKFKKCPILLGSNLNEGSWFLIYELSNLLSLTRASIPNDKYKDSMNRIFNYFPQYPNQASISLKQNIFNFYNNTKLPNGLVNLMAIDQAVTDSQFICSVNEFALSYANSNQKTFMYYLTERYSSNPWPVWMGVLHGDDILFLLGEPYRNDYFNFTQTDLIVANFMMVSWANFAKFGTPNKENINQWPLYSKKKLQYVEITSCSYKNGNYNLKIGTGPRVKQCKFWKENENF